MNILHLSGRMFDRTNSFVTSVNMVSNISNKEIVNHLVENSFYNKIRFAKAFDAVCDNIENLTKVEFIKVIVNRMEDTMFKLDFERITSLKELAKSHFIINGVNAAIVAFIYKAIHPNLSINHLFIRESYIHSISEIIGATTLPLVPKIGATTFPLIPKIITIPDEETLETLQDEYYCKQEETMNIDIPTDYVVESTEDAGYTLV